MRQRLLHGGHGETTGTAEAKNHGKLLTGHSMFNRNAPTGTIVVILGPVPGCGTGLGHRSLSFNRSTSTLTVINATSCLKNVPIGMVFCHVQGIEIDHFTDTVPDSTPNRQVGTWAQ